MRSTFKKTTVAVAVTLTLSAALVASAEGASRSDSAAPLTPSVDAGELRNVTPLVQKWSFVQDDSLSDAQALASDGFELVHGDPAAHLELQ